MGCICVCGAAAGALDGAFAVALAVLGFAVVAALAVAVMSVLLGYVWVLTVAVLAACVLGSVATVRLIRYGCVREVFRRHRRVTGRPALERARVPVALPRGTQLAIGAPKRVIPGVVLDDVHEEAERSCS